MENYNTKVDAANIMQGIKRHADGGFSDFIGTIVGLLLYCGFVFGIAFLVTSKAKVSTAEEIGVYIAASTFLIMFSIAAFCSLFRRLTIIQTSQFDAIFNLLNKDGIVSLEEVKLMNKQYR